MEIYNYIIVGQGCEVKHYIEFSILYWDGCFACQGGNTVCGKICIKCQTD